MDIEDRNNGQKGEKGIGEGAVPGIVAEQQETEYEGKDKDEGPHHDGDDPVIPVLLFMRGLHDLKISRWG